MTNHSVQHPPVDPASEPVWFTSSHSGQNGGNCVEVATQPHLVLVRDSKDPRGGSLSFTPAAWAAFTDFVSSGDLLDG